MADYHQIVEQIRTALHSGDPGHNGRLAGLASAYADACTEAAQRLGRCHRLLQQGLRSEAIQLAESEPKLLDTLAVLDFPERPEWDDVVQMRNLTPAPRIPLEPARLLNEAYADEDPLQELLRRHRRLALQRAPLKLRIAVLRQLAAQDPGSPIWAEDLRTFEQARMLEIQDEAAEAIRRHDAERDPPAGLRARAVGLDRDAAEAAGPVAAQGRLADQWRARPHGAGGRRGPARRGDPRPRPDPRPPGPPRVVATGVRRRAAARRPDRRSGPAGPRLARRAGPPGPREPRARGRPRRPGPRPRLSGLDRAGRARAAGPRRPGSRRRPPRRAPPALHLPPPRRRGGADAPQADHLGRFRRGRDPGRHADLPRRPVPGPRPPGRSGRHRDRRHARARRARPRRHRGQEPRGVRPGPPQVSRAGRGPPARGDRPGEGVGTSGEVRPGDARGPGGAPLGQASRRTRDRPLARAARDREDGARQPGPDPRRRAPGRGGPPREGAHPAPRRGRQGRRPARTTAQDPRPGSAGQLGPAGIDRRFPAGADGNGVGRGDHRRGRAGPGAQPLRAARRRPSPGWTSATSRPGWRTRSPRPWPIRPTAGPSPTRPRWPRPSRPTSRRSPTRPARGPSRPRCTTSRSGTRSASGTISRPAGGRAARQSPRRRPPSAPSNAGNSPSSIPRRPISSARRPTGTPWRRCRTAPSRARVRSASSRS